MHFPGVLVRINMDNDDSILDLEYIDSFERIGKCNGICDFSY